MLRLRSIRAKFMAVTMATTLAALLVNAAALVLFEYRSYRQTQLEDIRSRAEFLGRASAAAIAFNDRKDAEAAVRPAADNPDVLAVALYKPNGELFASYAKPEVAVPATPQRRGFSFRPKSVEGFYDIDQGGAVLGTVYFAMENDLATRLARFIGILTAVLLFALFLAFIVSRLLERGLTAPILNVAQAARTVVEREDYSVRVSHMSEDETGVLADAFNRMLGEVERRTAALQAEMKERLEAEKALRAADRRKDEFLATLAHELRNPMAPIRTSVQLLKLKTPADAEIRFACDVADRQIRHLTRLLDDLLDVGRITSNKLELQRVPTRVQAVVAAAIETATPNLEGARHLLSVDQPQTPLWVDVDPVRLAQAISNLLLNAVKYTKPGGHITLAVSASPANVEIAVTDDGIGIEAEALTRIFEMFAQAGAPIDRTQGGLGIGLYLVKQLVEMHGGEVSASSAGRGRGSTFRLRLPRLPEPVTTTSSAQASGAGGDKQRVIVVDDNADAAATLASLLDLIGYEVQVANDGFAALEIARQFRPQVGLLDIGMPGMNGYELARRIRAEAWGASVLLVAVTGWGQDADRRQALESGFDHHLTKPVDTEELQALLANLQKVRATRPA